LEVRVASTGSGDAGSEGDAQPDPRAKLMQEVAEEMDQIETDFGDEYQIGRVVTIVEVIRPNGEVNLRVRAGQLPWVTLGMLRFAQKVLESQIQSGSQ
jgi:hypothetical protein